MKGLGRALLILIIVGALIGGAWYFTNGADPQKVTLSITVSGSGYVTKTPDFTSYDFGSDVQLRAYATSGSTWAGWGGSIPSGTMTNPITIRMDGNKSITAAFIGGTPPEFEELSAYEGAGGQSQSFPNPSTVVFTNLPKSAESYLQKGGAWNLFDVKFHLIITGYTPITCLDASGGAVGISFARSANSISIDSMDYGNDGFCLFARQYTGQGTRIEPTNYAVVSSCGSGLLGALHGTGTWTCTQNHVHTAVIDLGASYDRLSFVTGRSCTAMDPNGVNVYVGVDGLTWTSTAQSITTGRYLDKCTGVWGAAPLCVCGGEEPLPGRYVKVEVTSTEGANNQLAWGNSPASQMFRIFQYSNAAGPTTSIILRADNHNSGTRSAEVNIAEDTDYYIHIYKMANGTIFSDVYTDNTFTTLYKSLFVLGIDTTDYLFFLPFMARGDLVTTASISGQIDSVDFQ